LEAVIDFLMHISGLTSLGSKIGKSIQTHFEIFRKYIYSS